MIPADRRLLRTWLAEDLGGAGDVTSRAVLPSAARTTAHLIANEPGILAGAPYATELFRLAGRRVRVRWHAREGARIRRGQRLATVTGPARDILAAERTALNLLGHLCGIATLARRYVDAVRGTRARIYDTRKTVPGLRTLAKYAVRVGGGCNHRLNLSDQILIKTNHLNILGGLRAEAILTALMRAQRVRPRRFIVIEAATTADALWALVGRADCVLLDNLPRTKLRRAVALRRALRPTALLEASGGVTLGNVRAIAQTGVNRISVGALTKHAASLDLALRVR